MSSPFPDELQHFIDAEVASGRYEDPNQVVVDAIRVLRDLRQQHAELAGRLAHSIAQADRGEVRPLDVDELKREVRELLARDGIV